MNWLFEATTVISRPLIFNLSPGFTMVRLPWLSASYAVRKDACTMRSFESGGP